MTYLKLFAAMGLTWTAEIAAWSLSDRDKPAPQIVIVVFNVLNIFQVRTAKSHTKSRTILNKISEYCDDIKMGVIHATYLH